eukprot:8507051-Alexandrium_andersonii.AAC.1
MKGPNGGGVPISPCGYKWVGSQRPVGRGRGTTGLSPSNDEGLRGLRTADCGLRHRAFATSDPSSL